MTKPDAPRGWKVCCADVRVHYDGKTSCMVLTCPHGNAHLGIGLQDRMNRAVDSGYAK